MLGDDFLNLLIGNQGIQFLLSFRKQGAVSFANEEILDFLFVHGEIQFSFFPSEKRKLTDTEFSFDFLGSQLFDHEIVKHICGFGYSRDGFSDCICGDRDSGEDRADGLRGSSTLHGILHRLEVVVRTEVMDASYLERHGIFTITPERP